MINIGGNFAITAAVIRCSGWLCCTIPLWLYTFFYSGFHALWDNHTFPSIFSQSCVTNLRSPGVLRWITNIKWIISHVSISMKRNRVYCSIFVGQLDYFFLYNKQNNTWMFGNMKLFLVLNRISHSFTLFTREISWSTLEVNFIFPHIHVFCIYSWNNNIFVKKITPV